MRFRLETGQVVTLDDECVNLSTLLDSFLASDSDLLQVVDDLFASSMGHKKHRAEFISVLKRVFDSDLAPVEQQLRTIAIPESELSTKFKLEQAHLTDYLEFLQIHIDDVFEPFTHRLTFLKEKTLLAVIEYLTIKSGKRSNEMFDDLPSKCKGCDLSKTQLKEIVDSDLHVYMDFIERFDDATFMDLSKAAVELGIHSLSVLVGCRMAQMIQTVGESGIRNRFALPSTHFVDSTNKRLEELLASESWLKMVQN